jgi:hypothetical protein
MDVAYRRVEPPASRWWSNLSERTGQELVLLVDWGLGRLQSVVRLGNNICLSTYLSIIIHLSVSSCLFHPIFVFVLSRSWPRASSLCPRLSTVESVAGSGGRSVVVTGMD